MVLERTERSRREWVADVSHELRTPLATVRAEVEALQDGVRPLSPQAVDSLHLDIIRLGRLVDDLYDLSRSDLGALSYHKESLDPSAVLRADLQALSSEFEKPRIAIELNADAGVRVHGDADRLAQLFRNILTNSLRYTDADGRLKVDVVRDCDWVIVSFEDSSPGVPAADLPHLLERFHRVERSRNRGTGGAGLGLTICESIAAAHGGRIEVRHGLLGGLGVQVWLPVNLPFTVKGPGQNKVSNNEGAEAPRQQGAGMENTLEYSTAKDNGMDPLHLLIGLEMGQNGSDSHHLTKAE